MNIDITAAALATVFVFAGGHLITYLIKQGEINQWRKEVDEKLEDMASSLAKMQDIHTLERLNAQKLDRLATDFTEHKKTTEGQFERLGNKLDSSFKEILKAVVEIAKQP